VSSFDELQARLGTFEPTVRQPKEVWKELCVCGHLDRYHSESVGGQYRLPATRQSVMGGVEWTVGMAFFGCVGALPGRGFEAETATVDREKLTNIRVVNPTCPCDDFRAVARVDRGNRMFNQRMPTDRTDDDRHPFVVGLRALTTFLSRRKAALADPSWTKREFDRRFTWLDGKRVCGISRCKETADVWPVFVDGERSELRCGPHRSRP